MAEAPPQIEVEVVYSPQPRQVWLRQLRLPAGATALDALARSGVLREFPSLSGASLHVSCWGRRCSPEFPLRDGDRLEVCRPLRVDPKKARRERFVAQGMRTAGLFARKRAGAKAGY